MKVANSPTFEEERTLTIWENARKKYPVASRPEARITSKDKARANIGIIPKDVKLIIVSTKKDKEIKQKEMANLKRVGLWVFL